MIVVSKMSPVLLFLLAVLLFSIGSSASYGENNTKPSKTPGLVLQK